MGVASGGVGAAAATPSSGPDDFLFVNTSRNRTVLVIAVVGIGDVNIVIETSLTVPAGWWQGPALGQRNRLIRLWAVIIPVDVFSADWNRVLLPLVEVAERTSVVGIER